MGKKNTKSTTIPKSQQHTKTITKKISNSDSKTDILSEDSYH